MSALRLFGLVYTTLSLAVLPVALFVMYVFLAGFRENGPQSRGLAALAVIYAAILLALGINTLIAGCLSYRVTAVRPSKIPYLATLMSLLGLGSLLLLWIAAGRPA